VSERRQSHNKRRRNPRLETLPENRTNDQRVTSQAFAVSINKVFAPQSPKAEGSGSRAIASAYTTEM
jgi:hypothetical protein